MFRWTMWEIGCLHDEPAGLQRALKGVWSRSSCVRFTIGAAAASLVWPSHERWKGVLQRPQIRGSMLQAMVRLPPITLGVSRVCVGEEPLGSTLAQKAPQ